MTYDYAGTSKEKGLGDFSYHSVVIDGESGFEDERGEEYGEEQLRIDSTKD